MKASKQNNTHVYPKTTTYTQNDNTHTQNNNNNNRNNNMSVDTAQTDCIQMA